MKLKIKSAFKNAEDLLRQTLDLAKSIKLPGGMYETEDVQKVDRILSNLEKYQPSVKEQTAYKHTAIRAFKDFDDRVRPMSLTNGIFALEKLVESVTD